MVKLTQVESKSNLHTEQEKQELHSLQRKFGQYEAIEPLPFVDLTKDPELEFSCFLCAEKSHVASACPQALCSNCKHPGHSKFVCQYRPPYQYNDNFCNLCQASGHSASQCILSKAALREKEIAVLRCYLCRERGHLNCYARVPTQLSSSSSSNSSSSPSSKSTC